MATMTNAAAPTKVLSQQKSAFAGNGRALAPARVARVAARNVAARAEVKEIHMPALSSTMTEGKIVSWLKGEGEQISKGEAVVVVESDKADMDVETFYDGYLAYIAVPDGEMATVGAPIAFVAETEAEIAEAKAKAAASRVAPRPPPRPRAGARRGCPSSPAPAAAAPAPTPAPAAPAPAPAPAAPAPVQGRADGRIIATPFAKKIAKKLRVDLATVQGTGMNGRITAGDVEKKAGVPSSAPAPAPPRLPPRLPPPAPPPRLLPPRLSPPRLAPLCPSPACRRPWPRT